MAKICVGWHWRNTFYNTSLSSCRFASSAHFATYAIYVRFLGGYIERQQNHINHRNHVQTMKPTLRCYPWALEEEDEVKVENLVDFVRRRTWNYTLILGLGRVELSPCQNPSIGQLIKINKVHFFRFYLSLSQYYFIIQALILHRKESRGFPG